jgi:L-asparaginase
MEAARDGIAVVRSSRVWGGLVVEGLSKWQDAGFVPAGTLPAQKARVLLQVALANGMHTPGELLRVFNEY